nr:MAG TPA: hypothetical protein [Caudoviricetes sp.]
MSDGLIGSLITGGLSLIAVIFTNVSANKKIVSDIKSEVKTNQAVTDEKITELTREVREHNNFARRMPVVEEQIKVINHRIKDLENGGK